MQQEGKASFHTFTVVQYYNGNDIMVRRKDLTGVHFRIGHLLNASQFLYEDNQAN